MTYVHSTVLGTGCTGKNTAANVPILMRVHFRKGLQDAENKQLDMQMTKIISN